MSISIPQIARLPQLFKENKSAVIFTGGSLFKTFAQIIASFFVLAFIDPAKMGIWNSVILFQTYAIFIQAGTVNGLNRELPYEYGRNNAEGARDLARTAQSYSMMAILMGILTGSIVFFLLQPDTPLLRISMAAVIMLTAFKFYEDYLSSTFRSRHSFQQLGWIYFSRGLMGLMTIPLIVYMDFQGYLIRILSVSALMLILLHIFRPVRIRPGFSFRTLKRLLATGIPIFILGYLFTSAATFDRVWLLKYEGTEMIGYYTLALMVYGAFQTLPIALANYIYPKFSFSVGRNENRNDLWNKAWKTNLTVFLVMLPVSIASVFLIPVLVRNFFQDYAPGIRASQIIIFASLFAGSSIGGNLLWSMKAWKWMSLIQLSSSAAYVVFTLLGIIGYKDPLIGAAVGVVLARFYHFILTNFLTWYATHR